jgi:hypothetical protein
MFRDIVKSVCGACCAAVVMCGDVSEGMFAGEEVGGTEQSARTREERIKTLAFQSAQNPEEMECFTELVELLCTHVEESLWGAESCRARKYFRDNLVHDSEGRVHEEASKKLGLLCCIYETKEGSMGKLHPAYASYLLDGYKRGLFSFGLRWNWAI